MTLGIRQADALAYNASMQGLSTVSEAWVEPPLVLSARVHGRAMMALQSPPGAASRRQREFAAGRLCAARALRQAGADDGVVGVASDRGPIWPRGFVGSISHTATLAWAVATRVSLLRSIGIDSEPIFDESALRDAARLALDEHEWQFARTGREAELATLVFSAKESLFKCVNPCVGEFFEFADARLDHVVPETERDGALELRLLRPLGEFSSGRRFIGRYVIAGGHVHTAVELPP